MIYMLDSKFVICSLIFPANIINSILLYYWWDIFKVKKHTNCPNIRHSVYNAL